MTELATTYVRIRPRSTGFKDEADTQLRRESPGDVSVSVTADTRPADDRLRAFDARLDQVRLKTATATVDVNDRAATVKLAAVDAALDRLDHVRANPTVDVEGIAAAEAKLEALNLQLDRVGERRVTAGGAGGGGLFNRLAGYGSQGGFFSPGGLAGAAVLAAPAAVPLGVAGLGLGASVLTPTAAGGAGLGLFGAATKGALTRVDKVQTQIEALNKRIAATPAMTAAASPAQIAAAQQRLVVAQARLAAAQTSSTFNPASVASAQAGVSAAESSLARAQGGAPNAAHDKLVAQRTALLKTLTPAENEARKETERLEKAWVHFQRELEPESFKLLATGTTILRKGLVDLLPMTKAVGDDVDHLAKRAEKALDDPFWQHFFGDFLTREAPKAVDALGTSVGNVVTGIAHLAEGWAPLGHDLEHDIVNITARFNAWTQGDGPGAFVALVRRDGPLAAQAIEGIAHGLVGIGKGLEPIGRVELQALTPVLNFIGDLGKQHPGVITALGVAYLGVAGGLKAIAAVKGLEGVLGGVRGLGRGGSGKGGVLGGILNSAGSLGGSPTNPMYVVVVNKGGGLPGGSGGASTAEKDVTHAAEGATGRGVLGRVAARAGIAAGTALTLVNPLTEVYIGTSGGDQNRAQTPLGSSTLRNGPAVTSLIAGVGPRIPLNQGQDFFSGSLDAPGGRPVNASALVNNTLTFGTPQQVARLKELARTYPAIAAGLKAWNQQQDVLNKLLVVNPGLAKNAASANKIVAGSLQDLAGIALTAGRNVGTNLGLGLIQGLEAQIPHANVAGQLLVASTAKHLRLDASANDNAAASVVPPVTSPKHKAVKQQAVTAGTDVGQAYGGGVASGVAASTPVVNTAVTNLVARIQARLQAAGAMEQQLTSSLLGQAGLAGFSPQTDAAGLPVAPTSAGIVLGLRHQKAALRLFRHRLHREGDRGLSAGAEQQIIALGLGQGGAYAASLAHDSRAQLRSISRLLGDVHGEAVGISKDVTRDIYGPKITDLLQKLVNLNQDSPDIAKEIKHLRHQLEQLGLEIRGAQHRAVSRTSH